MHRDTASPKIDVAMFLSHEHISHSSLLRCYFVKVRIIDRLKRFNTIVMCLLNLSMLSCKGESQSSSQIARVMLRLRHVLRSTIFVFFSLLFLFSLFFFLFVCLIKIISTRRIYNSFDNDIG